MERSWSSPQTEILKSPELLIYLSLSGLNREIIQLICHSRENGNPDVITRIEYGQTLGNQGTMMKWFQFSQKTWIPAFAGMTNSEEFQNM